MQRDHGSLLILALLCVLGAATLWLVTAIVKPAWTGLKDSTRKKRRLQKLDVASRVTAALLFLIGLMVGVVGMWETQNDQPRPAVTAEFNPDTLELTATATAHNLSIGERLVTLIVGLKQGVRGGPYTSENRYVAVSGPDASGDATQKVSYRFPKDTYTAIGVSASTGGANKQCHYQDEIEPPKPDSTTTTAPAATETATTSQGEAAAAPTRSTSKKQGPIVSVIKQGDLPGCAVILLPSAAPAG